MGSSSFRESSPAAPSYNDASSGGDRMATTARLGVLWDVDGTLVDTAELHFQAWVRLAREIDAPFTRDDFAATFGWRNPEIIPKLFGLRSDADIDALGRRKEDY